MRKTVNRKRNAGFTLVELIVVIVIMGILTAAILPTVTGYVSEARVRVDENNLKMVEEAARLYIADCEVAGKSIGTTMKGSALKEQGYLTALPEGTDYQITFQKQNSRYTIAQVEVIEPETTNNTSSD